MNIKTALKYRLNECKKDIFTFYLAIAALIILLYAAIISIQTPAGETKSLEITTLIFLFIIGLNSFREPFGFFLQNGGTRKVVMVSQLLSSLIICLMMSLIDNIILVLGKGVLSNGGKLGFYGIFEVIFSRQHSTVSSFLLSFLFCFSIYTFALSMGYMITTSYYRMNKGQKIAVSIGVPVFFIFVAPALDFYLLNNAIYKVLGRIINFMFKTPTHAILSCIILSSVFYGFSWLLTRRAVVKN